MGPTGPTGARPRAHEFRHSESRPPGGAAAADAPPRAARERASVPARARRPPRRESGRAGGARSVLRPEPRGHGGIPCRRHPASAGDGRRSLGGVPPASPPRAAGRLRPHRGRGPHPRRPARGGFAPLRLRGAPARGDDRGGRSPPGARARTSPRGAAPRRGAGRRRRLAAASRHRHPEGADRGPEYRVPERPALLRGERGGVLHRPGDGGRPPRRRAPSRTAGPEPEPAPEAPVPEAAATEPGAALDAPEAPPLLFDQAAFRERIRDPAAAARRRGDELARAKARAAAEAERRRRGTPTDIWRFLEGKRFRNPEGGLVSNRNNTLYYDDRGANLVPWIGRLIAEVRRNWYIPYAATYDRGHVAIAISVLRSGEIAWLQVVVPSGVAGFDNAAVGALRGAQLLPPAGRLPRRGLRDHAGLLVQRTPLRPLFRHAVVP